MVTLGSAQVITAMLLSNPKYTGGLLVGTVVAPPTLFGLEIDPALIVRGNKLSSTARAGSSPGSISGRCDGSAAGDSPAGVRRSARRRATT